MKKVLLTIGTVLTLCMISTVNSNSDDKITICHIPPGNVDNVQTITISVNALKAHIDHGDFVGGCEAEQHDAITPAPSSTTW